jgi:hypothetical protein
LGSDKVRTRIIIVVAIILLGMCSPLFADSTVVASGGLNVWTELAKTEYRMCEEVTLFIGVTNITSHNVEAPYVEEGSIQNLTMVLVKSDGRRQRYHGVSETTIRNPILIAPGDTVMFPIMVVDCFGSIGTRNELPGCIPPGDYSLEITYGGKYKFEITKLRILDTYSEDSVQIDRLNRVMMSQQPIQERIQMYLALYNSLVSTPLQGKAASDFLSELTRDLGQPITNLAMIKRIIHENPASGHMRWGFVALTRYFGDDQLKKAIREDPQLMTNRLSRNLLRIALYGIGKIDLYNEVMK